MYALMTFQASALSKFSTASLTTVRFFLSVNALVFGHVAPVATGIVTISAPADFVATVNASMHFQIRLVFEGFSTDRASEGLFIGMNANMSLHVVLVLGHIATIFANRQLSRARD